MRVTTFTPLKLNKHKIWGMEWYQNVTLRWHWDPLTPWYHEILYSNIYVNYNVLLLCHPGATQSFKASYFGTAVCFFESYRVNEVDVDYVLSITWTRSHCEGCQNSWSAARIRCSWPGCTRLRSSAAGAQWWTWPGRSMIGWQHLQTGRCPPPYKGRTGTGWRGSWSKDASCAQGRPLLWWSVGAGKTRHKLLFFCF